MAAYRSLGGATQAPTDTAPLLRSLHTQLRASITALVAELDMTDEEPKRSDAAGEGRKASAAVQQTLDRLPPPAPLDDRDASARTLLAAAAEDAAWGWRMIQVTALSPALREAATVLADHAAQCCEAAGPLLIDAAGGEPADGA